jgi:hypothetical protein
MRDDSVRGRTFSDVGVDQEGTLRNRRNQPESNSARESLVNEYLAV